MLRSLILVLCLSPLLSLPADAGPQDGAKILLHARTPMAKAGCVTDPPGTPATPCSQYTVQWPTGVGANVYLVVGQALEGPGLGAMSCSIRYDNATGSGVDIFGWVNCGVGLSPLPGPYGAWPASQSGILVLWGYDEYCQHTPVVDPDGLHVVAGFTYVYAYSDDQLELIPYPFMSGAKAEVVDCDAVVCSLPQSSLGSVGFGAPAGYNPCLGAIPVVDVSWGKIRTLY